MMRVLVACEYSGTVRDAFRAVGHDAYSCDLLPDDSGSPWHFKADALSVAADNFWHLLIAHPPCTYLCSSGLHWNHRTPGREEKTLEALRFVLDIMTLDVPRIAIENPVGRIGTAIRKADQYLQPYEYGHDASKRTGLWLKNLPKLKPTQHVAPRMVNGRKRWANQTDSGQNKLPPSAERWKQRSTTYQGIADAMAKQWGNL